MDLYKHGQWLITSAIYKPRLKRWSLFQTFNFFDKMQYRATFANSEANSRTSFSAEVPFCFKWMSRADPYRHIVQRVYS